MVDVDWKFLNSLRTLVHCPHTILPNGYVHLKSFILPKSTTEIPTDELTDWPTAPTPWCSTQSLKKGRSNSSHEVQLITLKMWKMFTFCILIETTKYSSILIQGIKSCCCKRLSSLILITTKGLRGILRKWLKYEHWQCIYFAIKWKLRIAFRPSRVKSVFTRKSK